MFKRKAIIINGKKRLLISGSIHYPRSTPEMWGDLIQKAKDGGLDVIQTYVFLNGHEPSPGNAESATAALNCSGVVLGSLPISVRMGSEVPPAAVTIHVTGFKSFYGVAENPTETIVCNLEQYLQRKGLPKGLILGSCSVLETAGEGVVAPLYSTLKSDVESLDSEPSSMGQTILLHFGVNSGATTFAIENHQVNEATFRCPDEMGWKPQNVPIVPRDGDTTRTRETALHVDEITAALTKMGYGVAKSSDAGCFVCNYVYYHSLRVAEENKIKSLFVHVPLFMTVDEETQMQFTASLLEVLASLC